MPGLDPKDQSDGHHTFRELYEHRYALWIALCRQLSFGPLSFVKVPWRSKLHSDGTMFEGSFVLGAGRHAGDQITYHLPLRLWDECDFAETLDRAPEYDGHTPADTLERLKRLR